MAKPKEIFNRQYKWYKRVRSVGVVIILSALIGVYFNYLLNRFNDIKSDDKEIKFKSSLSKSYDASLDTMKEKFDNSNLKIINLLAKTFGEYKLRLDSSQNGIARIV